MATYSEKFKSLVAAYRDDPIEFPQLKPVTIAQWMCESGRGNSKLATDHNNFSGLKWRDEMQGFATPVTYQAHDGTDRYCKFTSSRRLYPDIGTFWSGHPIEAGATMPLRARIS
jgi:N-acetylmuramoyl-L-alanine amidase